MNSNLKIPSPWAQLAILFGLAGGGAILAAMVLHLIPGMPAEGIPQTPGLIKLAQAIGSICLFGVPSIVFAFLIFRKHPMATLGFRPAVKNSFYLIAVLLLLCSFPLEGWLGLLNKKLPLAPWMVQMEKDNDKLLTSILQTRKPFDVAINL